MSSERVAEAGVRAVDAVDAHEKKEDGQEDGQEDDEDEDDEPAGDGEGRKDMGGMEDGEGGGEEVVGRVRRVAAAAGGLLACTGVAGTCEKVGKLYQLGTTRCRRQTLSCTTFREITNI